MLKFTRTPESKDRSEDLSHLRAASERYLVVAVLAEDNALTCRCSQGSSSDNVDDDLILSIVEKCDEGC